tara:strand:- start:1534 stop:3267 length:1734 start_codon:yes stop_codon:yes gene_type:complete
MFSNYNYDIIIIGGGISGLFLAYKLIDTNLKIIVLEGNQTLGGRIKTIYKQGDIFEAGAARIHHTHGKLLSLIHDLNLHDELVQLPSEIDSILRNQKENYPYQTKNQKYSALELLKKSVDFQHDFEKKELDSITFFQYLTLIYDHETALYIKDTFGYDSEFTIVNASSALDMFQSDFFGENEYYALKNGLSKVIQRLEEEISKSKIIIKKNCFVDEIYDNYLITEKRETFYFNHLISTIPKSALQKIHKFKDFRLFNSVSPVPLLRIYAKYPVQDLWFQKIKRTTTDNYIRQIIPINYETGLIMISYTDGDNATLWSNYQTLGDDFLIAALHKEINELFHLTPPKPEYISVHYWNEGVHLWNTTEDSRKNYEEIIQPYPKKEIYICGESYSLRQGWIEGSLETCYSVIQKLPILKRYDIVNYEFKYPPLQQEEEEKQEVKKREKKVRIKNIGSQNVDIKDKGRNQPKKGLRNEEKDKINNRRLTIEEVLLEDEYIIIEVNGKKNIYDLSEWIPKHPGGSIIYRGIEANKHYQNKRLYPESPTDIFKSIHSHEEGNVFERYFLRENDLVKFVGTLIES